MDRTKVENILVGAIDLLYEKDFDLLKRDYDISERTISHRLAIYIETFFQNTGYQVDIEYNRMREKYGGGDDIGNLMGKRLNWENSGEGSSYVYPDIIVHKRDTDQNLVEIEIKMAWKNRKKDSDYKKINEYMSELGYEYGVYIELYENRKDCLIEFGPFDLKNRIRKK